MNDDFFGVQHPLLDIVYVDIGLSHLAHTILRYLTLRTLGFGIIYWAFGPLFPVVSFTFYPWTCETPKNPNFWRKGKTVISVENP